MSYCPDAGDIVWLGFDPTTGREQSGHRPALVLSRRAYNEVSELCVVCPITSRVRGWAYETVIEAGLPVSGAVMCDQVKSTSWSLRGSRFACRSSDGTLADVRSRIDALLSICGED